MQLGLWKRLKECGVVHRRFRRMLPAARRGRRKSLAAEHPSFSLPPRRVGSGIFLLPPGGGPGISPSPGEGSEIFLPPLGGRAGIFLPPLGGRAGIFLPPPGGGLGWGCTQADRALGRILRGGGIVVNCPSLWRTSRQPSSWTIRW